MDKNKIQTSLKTFTSRVKRMVSPEDIRLFGSFAHGKPTENSDVDIVVIAKTFKIMSETKRFDLLYEMSKDLLPDFHVFGYTPEEYQHADKATTLSEVKRTSISLL